MTTATLCSPFEQAMSALHAAHAAFSRAELSSVAFAHARESALAQALTSLADSLGVKLQQPLQIDSRGEFSIVALNARAENPQFYGCGTFGPELAALLTQHKGRTGAFGPCTFEAGSGWCRLNHFDAERLVTAHAQALSEG